MTIGCTCMEQGGGWSLREGSFTVNTRGRLDCAIFFLLPRGPRHERELQQSAAVTRWWRACGREGRGCGLTAATSARPGCAVRCRRELVRTRVSSPAWSLCCESCVQCGPTVYSATRRACGRVEGNFWLLYHLANVRTLTRYTVGPDTGACTPAARSPSRPVRRLQ